MKKQFCCAAAGTLLLCGMLTGCGDSSQTAAENSRLENTTVTTPATERTNAPMDDIVTDGSGLLSDAGDVVEDIGDAAGSVFEKATSEIGVNDSSR